MDIQDAWDRFLVDCWIADKGRSMIIMMISFQSDHGCTEVDYSNPFKLKRFPDDIYRGDLDVFGFVARYLPKLSTWLLAHVKNHQINPETKEKIIQAMKSMKLPAKYGGVGQANEARTMYHKTKRQLRARTIGENISISQMRSRHAWNVVK